MATVTHGVALADTANATSYVTGAFTPAADDLLVVFVGAAVTVAAGSMTDSLGGTYTKIDSAVLEASTQTGYLFIRDSLVAASSTTVTFDCTGDAATGCIIFVARVAGMTNTGSAASLQTAKQENQITGAPAPAPVFASSCLTSNPTLGFVYCERNPAAMTPPTDWTEDAAGDTGHATPTRGAEYVFRDSGFTGTTITWGNTAGAQWASISVELDASSAAPGVGRTFPRKPAHRYMTMR